MQVFITIYLSYLILFSLVSKESLDVAREPWGVKVERFEVKDVRVSEQLQRAMAAEAEAAREASHWS